MRVLSKGKVEPRTTEEYEQLYTAAKALATPVQFNREGQKYSLSTEILRATLLTNLVYPVYKHGENVVHYTPGKRWDSFYTWDSGVIGTGVLEFSPEKCRYILETYLSQPGEYGLCVSAPRLSGAYPVCAVFGTAAPHGGQGAPVCSVSADEAVL